MLTQEQINNLLKKHKQKVPMQELKDEIKSITVSKQNSLASMNDYGRYLES